MVDPEFQQFKERVKSLVAIEQIVGERVASLKRAGSSWKACCPFHQERTPSFHVNPERGTWHCFGACGTGGDALDFVMRFDGVPFIEALEQLASRVGLELPKRAAKVPQPDLEPTLACLAEVAQQWQRSLRGPAGRAALEYLRGRGLADATIDEFGLGWAADGALRELGRQRHWPARLLAAAGLIKRGEDGSWYEFFRARVMFPIRDRDARVVAFGARTLRDGAGPKYVNTGETEVFHKGRVIYALDRALAHVRRSRHLILAEGYTDVMAFHQAGVSNAVAVLGSALTDDHASLVRRSGATRVTCFFDGDDAGRKATWRALHGLLPQALTIDVAVPPEGDDPGDFLAAGRGAELARLVSAPRDWLEFLAEPLRGAPAQQLADGVGQIVELIARLRDPVLRDARLAELARRVELPVQGLRERLETQSRRPRALDVRTAAAHAAESDATSSHARAAHAARSVERAPSASNVNVAWERIIGGLLLDNSLVPLHAHVFERCGDPDRRAVLDAIVALHGDASDLSPVDSARLYARLDGDHPLRQHVAAWEADAANASSAAEHVNEQLEYLNKCDAERRISEARTGPVSDQQLAEIKERLGALKRVRQRSA